MEISLENLDHHLEFDYVYLIDSLYYNVPIYKITGRPVSQMDTESQSQESLSCRREFTVD